MTKNNRFIDDGPAVEVIALPTAQRSVGGNASTAMTSNGPHLAKRSRDPDTVTRSEGDDDDV